MKKSDGRSTSRLARALGLIIVLGLPLAAASPLDPGFNASRTGSNADQLAANSSPAAASSGEIDGYTPAAPASVDQAAPAVEVRRTTRPGATPVTTIVNDPRCGVGFTSTAVTGSSAFACFHSVLDPLPPEVGQPTAKANASAPVCLGNGVNGPRIQLLYMYVQGQPNRTAQVVPRIVGDIVPKMEHTFRETSKQQGREIGMRLHMPGCQLAVDTLEIDAERGAPGDPGEMLTLITERLIEAGYDSTDRKFIVWFDGGNKGACGIAPVNATPVLDDNPTQVNRNNVGWQVNRHETAVIFRYGQPILGEANFGGVRECWGQGGTGARTEIHELIHLIGAVQFSAPNSNGLGHCTDDHDIMCYGEAGVSTVPRCATPIEQLDCGSDDYFNSRPPAGSYLSTNWNTANSRFLGDAIVHDTVPVEIPRP